MNSQLYFSFLSKLYIHSFNLRIIFSINFSQKVFSHHFISLMMITRTILFRTFLSFIILAFGIEIIILITTKIQGWNNFQRGRPFLAAVHVHLMVLGAIMFLINILLDGVYNITQARFYKTFYIVYLVGISLAISMMLYKGFVQLYDGKPIGGLKDAVAAIGHTTTFVGLFFFCHCVYEKAVKEAKSVSSSSQETDA
ncbi:hypothetical protein TRFO_30576 [Tritrichomonas foetus]|uniref:Uncharacterized protein n=1 Tax=Tritrichomonas foetus TaxID=1144522 RepID=A0A1J4JUJ2_9EUKA|nr:hypothetical protein TRFO_30576 [Tritrichomonas foetus]|eukprot:OHT02378.1 hypothetical protein TRFO_30576 [Tritrichomonas foetus]